MVMVLELVTLILSHNYHSNNSRQLLNSFKNLTITCISIVWSSAPLSTNVSCINFGNGRYTSLNAYDDAVDVGEY